MRKVFKARFIAELKADIPELLTKELKQELYGKEWVVYAKRPFGSVHSVIEYLGRYTHKIAISNHRQQDINGGKGSFTYKDYRANGKKSTMTLDSVAFVRRFAMHILDKGLVRIRHYGILSNTANKEAISVIRKQLRSLFISKSS